MEQIDPRSIATLSRQTLEEALATRAQDNSHLLVLLPEKESPHVRLIQQLCRERQIILAGAVFPEIIRDGVLCQEGAVLLWIAHAPAPLLMPRISHPDAVDRVANALSAHIDQHLADNQTAGLFCIFDALVPNIGTHLDAWYLKLADRVNYFGVNAGNERFQPAPCLFDHEHFLADGLLIQLFPDHPGACLDHSYAVPDTFISATSATGNRIVQIDWQPALSAYRELMQAQYGVEIDRGNFYTHAVHFPFGIVRANGEVLVRIPVALAEDDSIVCVGEIPSNSVLALLDARTESHQSPSRLAHTLKGRLDHGEDLLLFYCAGRRMHMGEKAHQEIADVHTQAGAGQMVGALSLGEIGSSKSGGYPLFHNATLVGIPCRAL